MPPPKTMVLRSARISRAYSLGVSSSIRFEVSAGRPMRKSRAESSTRSREAVSAPNSVVTELSSVFAFSTDHGSIAPGGSGVSMSASTA